MAKRIDLYVPEYGTGATITVDENHSSETPHLVTKYKPAPPSHGNQEVAAAIPDDWTDKDILSYSLPHRRGTGRDWPSWEIPASGFGAISLIRFWKGRGAAQGLKKGDLLDGPN